MKQLAKIAETALDPFSTAMKRSMAQEGGILKDLSESCARSHGVPLLHELQRHSLLGHLGFIYIQTLQLYYIFEQPLTTRNTIRNNVAAFDFIFLTLNGIVL